MSVMWSGGAWGPPAAIAQSAVARGQPFLDATGGTTSHIVFQDNQYHYWYFAFTGTWSSSPQQVGTSGNQLYGPLPATIAARGTAATIGFMDGQTPNSNYVAQADLSGGAWAPRVDIAGLLSSTMAPTIPPSIIPLSAGPELMMVFAQLDGQLDFVTRTGGTWSTPTPITNAKTYDRVALAPLAGGGAILGFRGQDTNLYWSICSVGTWSAPAPFSTPTTSIDGPPAITQGIGGAVAEIAFLQQGTAYHARLAGSAWSSPVAVGGTGLVGVAIASAP
jgi:hypothetical protein